MLAAKVGKVLTLGMSSLLVRSFARKVCSPRCACASRVTHIKGDTYASRVTHAH